MAAHWSMMVANFSGVIYTCLVIAGITIVNLSLTCPALYGPTDCHYAVIFASVCVFQIVMNLILFHFYNKRNQIAYWTIKSSPFLANNYGGSRSTAVTIDAEEEPLINGDTGVDFPMGRMENRNGKSNGCGRNYSRSGIKQRNYSNHGLDAEENAERASHFKTTMEENPTPQRPVRAAPHTREVNVFEHMNTSQQLMASDDGIYRREMTQAEIQAHNGAVPSATKFCVECNQTTPRRCHHCPICDICVLRKDHHCFMTGGCVGLANQRYFIVFLLWATLGATGGAYFNFAYMNQFIRPWYPTGWLTYIAPVALFRWFLGWDTFGNACLAILLSVSCASGLAAFSFLCAQIFYTANGYTMHDYHVGRLKDNLESDGENVSERFALVFGRRWWANFFIPQVWMNNQMTPGIARNIFLSISKDL